METIKTPANFITAVRLCLLGALILYLENLVIGRNFVGLHPLYADVLPFCFQAALLGVLLLLPALDFFDGWAARKFNCASDFGYYFDQGVDQLTEWYFWWTFIIMGDLPNFCILLPARLLIKDAIILYLLNNPQAIKVHQINSFAPKILQWIVGGNFPKLLYNVVKFFIFVSLFFHKSLPQSLLIFFVTWHWVRILPFLLVVCKKSYLQKNSSP